MTISLRSTVLVAHALLLAGCGSERMTAAGFGPQQAPLYTGSIRPAVDMAGRWTLTSPGRGQCHVNISAAPGAPHGPVAPEGGCPGNFYMSRHWVLESSALVLRDHNGQPLGQLSPAGPGRFDGRAMTGEPIVLSR